MGSSKLATLLGLAASLLCGCFQSRAAGDAGADVDAEPSCGLTTPITFGWEGGWPGATESFELIGDGVLVATRTTLDGTITTCTTQIPPCDAADTAAMDIGDIASTLSRPEVRAALAEAAPPLYGHDSRPADGQVFVVSLPDGRGFVVGDPCGSRTSCTPIPPVVGSLVTMLQNLIDQELARPECSALR